MPAISDLKLDSGKYLGVHPFWAFWIGSAVIAALIGSVVYTASSGPQAYDHLIVGPIAWRAASKQQDYYLLLGILFGFLGAFSALTLLSAWLRKKIRGAADEFHTLIAFASLPAVLWFGRLVLSRETSMGLLELSAGLIGLVLVFSIAALLKDATFETAASFSDSVSASVMIVLWGVLSGMAVALACSRLGLAFHLGPRGSGMRFAWLSIEIFASLGVLLVGVTWSALTRGGDLLLARLRKLVIAMQGGAPWFFLILLPTPWVSNGHRYYGDPIRPVVWLAIAALMIVAYGDLARRWRRKAIQKEKGILSAISPVCLMGVLLFIKCSMVEPNIPSDDYTFGEFAIPWWSWSVHNMVPFWDYSPARGLINYLPGLFSSIFFDGTAATFPAAGSFIAAFLVLLCFPIVAKSIGAFPAFMVFLPMPLVNGISEIHILITAALCLLCETYLAAPSAMWLPIWFGLGIASVLVGVGQGGLLVLATLPLGVAAVYRAITGDRMRLYKTVGIFLAAGGIISFLTPFGLMLYGAIRYGIEQSAINSIAHSVEWAQSWKIVGTPGNQWLWEIARSSWVLVGILAGMVILCSIFDGFRNPDKRSLVFAVPIFLMTALYIFRAAGRIDPGSVSRLGFASIWAHSLLLPILLLNTEKGKQQRALILTGTIFLAAVLSPFFTPLSVEALQRRSTEVVTHQAPAVTGKEVGLPNLGHGKADAEHLARLISMKRTLARLVDPGETYLDLTNHNAHYFYFGYRPPIEAGAVYNLVHENQQIRAIKKIHRDPPPVIALDSTIEQRFDGGTVGYRSHLLYRYLIDHYVPVEIDGRIYMVRPDRLERVGRGDGGRDPARRDDRLSLLDKVFQMGNIDELPVSWGGAFKSLKSKLRFVRNLGGDSGPLLHSLRETRDGFYSVIGSHPSLTFDVGRGRLNGRDAGLLTFDFICKDANDENDKAGFAVSWGSDTAEPSEATAVRF